MTAPAASRHIRLATMSATRNALAISVSVGLTAPIDGKKLALTPYLSANNDIVWRCGSAAAPTSASLDTSVTLGTTDVSAQYLPGACHL